MSSNGVPNLLPFQGRVTDTNGNPINYPVTINFRIYPPTGSCYLYEDTESVTPDSYGMFSVNIGTNSTGPANTLAQVFSNDGGTISNSCSGTYSPGANDWRLLQLVVDGTPLPQMETIGSSGFALNAFNLDGKDAASFIQVSGVVTQAALNTLISNGPYMQANGNTSTTGSITTGGNIYVPGASGSIGIGTSTTTADLEIQKTAPSFLLDAASGGGGTDTVNFSSGATQLGAIQAQDGTTGLKFYSGTSLAMTLDSSQNLILNGSLSVAGTIGPGKYTAAQETSLISTLAGMGLTATGTMWVNTTTNQLRYWDGSAAETILSSANQNANLIFAGPSSGVAAAPAFRALVAADLPASGVAAGTYKSVAVDTYGRVTSGTNPTTLSGYGITDAVQNGGGAPGMMAGLDASKPAAPAAGTVYFATDTHRIYEFNSGSWSLMASAVGSGGTVTNVTSANTDIAVASGTTTPVLTLNSGTGANQIVKLNGSAQLPAVDGSQLTNLNASNLASGTVAAGRMPALTGDVTSTAGTTATTVVTVGGSTAANIHSAEVAANAATSVDTANTILKRDASGRTNFGGIIFDGSTSGTVTVNPPSSVASYAMNLPAAQGGANTYLKNDGSGNLSWSTVTSGTVTNVATGTGLTGGPITGSGTISLATPTTTSIGGVEAINPVAHEWVNSISSAGVPQLSQPSFGDLSGSVTSSQMPALTGDVTSTAGSTATTVAKIEGTSVDTTAPTSMGQVLRYDGTSKYVDAFIGIADIRSTAAGNAPFFPTTCSSGQTLTYSSPTDTFVCTNIAVGASNFSSQAQATFLAAPTGAAGAPTFRTIASSDLPMSGVATGTYKSVTVDTYGRVTGGTNPTTLAGYGITDSVQNGGGTPELLTGLDTSKPAAPLAGTVYFATDTNKVYQYNSGAWALMASAAGAGGTVTSVGLTLPTIFSVTGSPVTTSGTLSATLASQTANTVLAAPSGANGAPTFRALTSSDLPTSGVATGTYTSVTVDTYGRVTAGTSPTTLTGYGITDGMQNLGGSPGIETGLDASKPAAPGAGTIYMATDTKKVYQYNSGAWSIMASAAGSGGTVTSVGTGTGLTGGPITGSGTISLATPTTTSIGGVEAVTPIAHEWVNSISSAGVPSLSQPSFSDLTGSVAATQMPALTGDVTSTAGSTATTVGKIQGKAVSSSAPTDAQIFAYNNTSSQWAPVSVSGDATMSNAGSLTLASTGVTAASYGTATAVPAITVDAKGRITSASNTNIQTATTGQLGLMQVGSGLNVSSGVVSLNTTGTSGAFVNGGNAFGSAGTLGTTDANNLSIETNGAAAMTIDTSQNVGIGTSTLTEKLNVNGNAKIQGQAYSPSQASSATSPLTFNTNSGNTMVWSTGTQSSVTANIWNMKDGATYTLILRGTGTGTTTINCYSDSGTTSMTSSFMPANASVVANATIYTIMSAGGYCYISWTTGWN